MRFSILGVIKTAVLLTLLGFLVVGGYAVYGKIPSLLSDLKSGPAPTTKGQEVVVSIPKGASLSQVGGLSQENRVISSRLVFKLVAMIRGEQRRDTGRGLSPQDRQRRRGRAGPAYLRENTYRRAYHS